MTESEARKKKMPSGAICHVCASATISQGARRCDEGDVAVDQPEPEQDPVEETVLLADQMCRHTTAAM